MARMVDAITEVDETHITCTGSIPRDSPFADGNRARSLVLIELSAQVAALLELKRIEDSGEPTRGRAGYLVRLRRIELSRPFVQAERPLTVHVERTGAAPPLYRYEARVEDDGEQLFAGSISTYIEPAGDPSDP